MGNLFTPKHNTATQSTAPPDDVLAQYKALLDRASGVSQGSTVAPFNPSQQQAFGALDQIPNQYLPQAQSYAEQGAGPITSGQISQYYNPFQQSVTDATMANINETNAEQQNQVVGNAIAQGALGGNRVGVAQGELARQQGLANNQTLAGLNAANYQQALGAAQADRSASQYGAGAFAGLQSQALQGIGAQLQGGTLQQQQAEQTLQQPYQQAGWLSQILGGIAPLEGQTQTNVTPAPSLGQQIIGTVLTGIGLAGGGLGGGGGGGSSQALQALGTLWARGGRVGYATGGGIAPNPDVSRMVSSAVDIARTLKGSRGIGMPQYEGGGVVSQWPVGQWVTSPRFDFGAGPASDYVNGAGIGLWGGPAALPTPSPVVADAAPDDGTDAAPPDAAPMSLVPPSGGIASTVAPAASSPAPPDAAGIAPTPGGKNAWSMPLIAAGLGILSSQSPQLGEAIGQGGTQALNYIQQQRNLDRQLAIAQSQNQYRNQRIDMEAARLDQQAKMESERLALESGAAARAANAPQSAQGKLKYDFQRGLISDADYAAATAANATGDVDIPTTIASVDNPNKPSPDLGGLTANGLKQKALVYLTNGGNIQGLGLSNSGASGSQRTLIANYAGYLSDQMGMDIPEITAAYKANSKAATSIIERVAKIDTTAQTLSTQFPRLAELATKVGDMGITESDLTAGRADFLRKFGSSDAASYYDLIQTLRSDYAAMQASVAGGRGGQYFAQNAADAIPAGLTPDQYLAIGQTIQGSAANAKAASGQEALSLISGGMSPTAATPGVSAEMPATAAPPPSPASPPMEGARRAPDGNWYVQQGDQWFMVQQAATP